MPLRAERRRALEWALRVALLATLAFALWRVWVWRDAQGGTTRSVKSRLLATELPSLLATSDLDALDISLDAFPSASERDALRALRHAGVSVTWTGAPPALALEAARVREPGARVKLLVPDRVSRVTLSDSAGVLDTVRTESGATLDVSGVVGDVRASQGTWFARAAAPPAPSPRAVLLLGRTGWETRFTAQALGEAGWTVRTRVPVAPGVTVASDAVLPLDTARYDAVIALDSTAADLAPQVARFVAEGGGLVAEGDALDVAALRALAPARASDRKPGRILLAEDTLLPRDLPVRPLVNTREDAVTIAHEASGITVAARRAGAGRVLAIGYDESWRWRMLGGASGADAHRRWWSSAVGAVSPERIGAVPSADAAPLASLVDALGPASSASSSARGASRDPLPLLLLAVIVIVLLAETASRRYRGLR